MEIRKTRLKNVGRFTDLEVAFAPTEKHASKVTVFVGNNGAGKTTILKSLATALSWFVARVKTEKGKGTSIATEVIKNSAHTAAIYIELNDINHSKNSDYYWTLSHSRQGRAASIVSELANATELAGNYRYHWALVDEHISLPLVAFYPVERSVLQIPLNVKKPKKNADQLDGYENSLSGSVNFARFFEWFRDREDSENETGIPFEILNHLKNTFESDEKFVTELNRVQNASRDRQLSAVRSAISFFMPGFDNLRVQRLPSPHMAIDKNGETLNVAQLSQGEKSLMALVGDIARRLAIMNPALRNPLEGQGVVLIDEVDLHLHPKWQRQLIQQLTTTFPNCQFILTTHSPLVISDTKDVLCYVLDDGELEERNGLYGLDANQVLLSVMDTDARNSEVQSRLDRLLELLQDKKLKEAKALFEELSTDLPPGHIELTKAALLIRKLELRSA